MKQERLALVAVLLREGKTPKQIREHLGINHNSLYKLVKEARDLGMAPPRVPSQHIGARRSRLKIQGAGTSFSLMSLTDEELHWLVDNLKRGEQIRDVVARVLRSVIHSCDRLPEP